MAATSTISLYTQEYYNTHKEEIDESSRCGNIVELVEIDNFIYVSIKATEYPYDDGVSIEYRDITMDEGIIQSDLDDLRSGVFNAYRMVVEQFLSLKNMQLTAGDNTDHVEFERFEDPVYGGRWRLILSERESVIAFSIKVYNNAGGYLYTPGSFIDQGDGTWMVESNYQEYDNGDVNFDFIYGSESITQIYRVDKDIQEIGWDISYFTEEVPGGSEVIDWVQPVGASDAYNIGDNVLFEGNQYESLIDANVWSPIAYPAGWELV